MKTIKTEMDGIPKHDARISIVNIAHIGILRTGYLLFSLSVLFIDALGYSKVCRYVGYV